MSIRDDFFENKAVAALWDVAVSIKRGNPLPLDSNSVFKSYAELETYTSGSLAYPGQIIAVVNENSTEIYYLDQNLSIKAVGSVPIADNKSIEVVDGILSVYNFGSSYYKYINEEKDDNGEIISTAHYEKVEVSTENPWKTGLEPKVVEENGEYVIGWFEPNPTTVDSVKTQLTIAQEAIDKISEAIGEPQKDENTSATGFYLEFDKKADKVSVYTKTEVDQLIASADHLKRTIFDNIEFAQTFVENNPDIAAQYIYMIPSGLQLDSNRYYEYMLIDDKLEPIGNWEVDLNDYFTENELKEYLEDYYTENEITTILTDYSKKTDLEGYYKVEEIDNLLNNYYTVEIVNNLLNQYVQKEEGFSLISVRDLEKLQTISNNAEPNFIKSVDGSNFIVTEAGQLNLKTIEVAQVADLQSLLDAKVNRQYTENADGSKTEWILLSPENQTKLAALTVGDTGNLEISGSVNADNVNGLGSWITTNRNTTAGLYPLNDQLKLLNIQEEAEKNFINSIDENDFFVTDRHLTLNKVSAEKLSDLSSDFTFVKGEGLSLSKDYITTSLYQAEIGDLTKLLQTIDKENTTIVDEIIDINERLQWQDITE